MDGSVTALPRDAVLVGGYHPGLLSGLALAGANTPSATADGILTSEEVSTLDLSRVDLAVLSACETGLGKSRAARARTVRRADSPVASGPSAYLWGAFVLSGD